MSDAIAEQKGEVAVLELHRKFLESGASDAFRSINDKAIARFETLGFPHPKHEMYTFVNTHEIASTVFQLVAGQVEPTFVDANTYASCQNSRIVFVDGVYDASLSNTSGLPEGVKLISLEEAVSQADIKTHLEKTIEGENDIFACLNAAFLKGGLLIEIEAGTVMESPFQVLMIGTAAKTPTTHHPRLLVRAGRTAEVKMVTKYIGTGGGYFVNSVQDFILEDGASVSLARVQADDAKSWHTEKTRVFQGRDSRFSALCGSGGSKLARVYSEIRLQGEGAEASLSNASVLIDEDQSHHFIRIHHEAAHTTSHQLFKNVINDKGRSSVDGTVIVNEGAQLTASHQLINNLMLSDAAHADNKPNLMIFADDVKCTHGATVGQIDEDQLFYLKTRGLAEDLATELLTTSFVESLISQVPYPEVLVDMETLLLKKLEVKND